MLVFHIIKHYSGLHDSGLLFYVLQIQKEKREQLYFKAEHGIQSTSGPAVCEMSQCILALSSLDKNQSITTK